MFRFILAVMQTPPTSPDPSGLAAFVQKGMEALQGRIWDAIITASILVALAVMAIIRAFWKGSRSPLVYVGMGIIGGAAAITFVIAALAFVPSRGLARLIAGAILGLTLLSLWLVNRRAKKYGFGEQAKPHIPNERVVVAGLEFYPSRQTLSVARPIKEHIRSAETVWAMWNAGTAAWASDVVKTGRIKKLLLPDPESSSVMAPLAHAVRREAMDIASDIRGLTKQALDSGVTVRWFQCVAGNTLTIGDPEKGHSGWIQLETLIPFTSANERPSFRISQGDFPELFNELIRAYDEIWKQADTPFAQRGPSSVASTSLESARLDSLQGELEQAKTERDNALGAVGQQSQELALTKSKLAENMALVALWSLERLSKKYAPETRNAIVTVQFIDHADGPLADRVVDLFHRYTKWVPKRAYNDGSEIRHPPGASRVLMESGTPEIVQELQMIFTEGNLLAEPVSGREIHEEDNFNILVTIFPRSVM